MALRRAPHRPAGAAGARAVPRGHDARVRRRDGPVHHQPDELPLADPDGVRPSRAVEALRARRASARSTTSPSGCSWSRCRGLAGCAARGRAASSIATRDNDRMAAAAGVDTVRAKLIAFVDRRHLRGGRGRRSTRCRCAGSACAPIPPSDSLLAFSMAVIGGIARSVGRSPASRSCRSLGYAVPRLQLILTGAGLLVILLVLPGGLAQAFERIRDAFAAWAGEAPRRRARRRARHGRGPVDAGEARMLDAGVDDALLVDRRRARVVRIARGAVRCRHRFVRASSSRSSGRTAPGSRRS